MKQILILKAVLLLTANCLLPTFSFSQNVGINATGALPNASAMLDISSTSKGLLIPRVSLTSTADVATIASPATSLLVYNTNAAMAGGALGYWYWDGAQWTQLGAGGGGPGNCASVNDAVTDTTTDAFCIEHTTTGTSAKNFGVGLLFKLQDATASVQNAGRIQYDFIQNGGTPVLDVSQLRFWTLNGNMNPGMMSEKLIVRGDPADMFSGYRTSELVLRGMDETDFKDFDLAKIKGEFTNAFFAPFESALTFFTRTGGAALTERMRINNLGNVGIGTTAPLVKLHASTDDAVTAAVTDVLQLNHSSSGVPAASFGTGLLFTGESSTTNGQSMARIQSIWTTATHASRASALQFQTLTAAGALATRMTIDGTGNVGIGTITPNSTLDISGNYATRMTTNSTLVNGNNNNVDFGTTSFVKIIAGPTAAFTITGIKVGPNGTNDGRKLILYNSTSQNMTISPLNTSLPENQIITPSGFNILSTGVAMCTFIYDDVADKWILISMAQ